MKAIARATAVAQRGYRCGFWALLALLVLIVASGCVQAALPTEDGGQVPAEQGLSQDVPPTRTAENIDVDLNAITPDSEHRALTAQCPELHGPLLQVIASEDPAQEAQALGLSVRNGQVQVTLVLDEQDNAFLERAGITPGKWSGRQVQAFVPISRLCELATDEHVLAIYPSSQAETQ